MHTTNSHFLLLVFPANQSPAVNKLRCVWCCSVPVTFSSVETLHPRFILPFFLIRILPLIHSHLFFFYIRNWGSIYWLIVSCARHCSMVLWKWSWLRGTGPFDASELKLRDGDVLNAQCRSVCCYGNRNPFPWQKSLKALFTHRKQKQQIVVHRLSPSLSMLQCKVSPPCGPS